MVLKGLSKKYPKDYFPHKVQVTLAVAHPKRAFTNKAFYAIAFHGGNNVLRSAGPYYPFIAIAYYTKYCVMAINSAVNIGRIQQVSLTYG